MTEIVKTTVRLSEEDRANVDKIISSGAATSTAEAIRVALRDAAQILPRLKAMERAIAEARSGGKR